MIFDRAVCRRVYGAAAERRNSMLRTAAIFSEGMILQREKAVTVWGSADPGAAVTVSIQGQCVKTRTGEDGGWEAVLAPLTASEQEVLTVKTDGEEIRIGDVAVGEVWIAGGQSNMEFPLRYEKYRDEESGTVNKNLRFYDVPEICYEGQDQDFDYSNVGIWRKAEGDDLTYFSAVGYYFQKEIAAKLSVPVGIVGVNWGGSRSCAWMREETIRRVGEPWICLYEESIADLDMEQYWKEQRTNPMNDRGNPNMGAFERFILPRTPSTQEVMEFFAQMTGRAGDGSDAPGGIPSMEGIVDAKTRPGCLYEHMVKVTAPYTARGVLWYQGESDDMTGLQPLYTVMLTGLIGDWRGIWRDETLPFLVVQLPGWRSWLAIKNEDYAAIRRCQQEVAESVPNVYLASISDGGEEFDIHPKDKRTVGRRLALLAENHVYGEELLSDAPAADAVRRDKDVITIVFRNAGTGMKIEGETVNALAVTCEGTELTYSARTETDRLVILLSEPVKGRVRIAFAQGDWYQVNLFNETGIPAIPFIAEC